MSLDPTGGIHLDFTGDTSDLNRAIDQAGRAVDSLAGSVDDLNRKKISVAPSGKNDLDAAARSADGLSKGLDNTTRAASRVKAPTGVTPELDKAAGAAHNLGSELDRAGAEASQLGGSAGGARSMNGALEGVLSTAKQLAPALSAAAVAGTVFTKGWDRLTAIDNAQFKLQGLGHEAEAVTDIMDAAMNSVSGTAYGFGDAASLAAGVVAATGAEGARLEQILTTVADTSAIAGRSLGDMGLIFNQVAASGTLMGDDLNQLMDSGIPVLQLLADELGVTAGEVKSLASEGQISFEQFEAAMRSGMGGAAQEMGNSITGALANVGAAAGRLGAEILDPFVSGGMSAVSTLTSGLDGLTSVVGGAAGAWDKLPGPVKDVAVAMGIATTAVTLLRTETGERLTDSLKSMVSGFAGSEGTISRWATAVQGAYMRGAQSSLEASAAHRMAAQEIREATPFSAGFWQGIDGIIAESGHTFGAWGANVSSVIRGTASTVKAGATAILDAFGGPLAVGLAAGTWAIGQAVSEAQNLGEIADLADEVRGSVTGLGDHIAESIMSGDISAAISGVEDQLQGFLDTQQELAEQEYNTFWGSIAKMPEMLWADWNPFDGIDSSDVQRDLADLWNSVDDAQAFSEALDQASISADDLGTAVHGSEAQFRGMISALQEAGPETSGLQLQLTNMRQEWLANEEAAEGVAHWSTALSGSFLAIGDASVEADDRVSALNDTLRAMAGIEMSYDEALVNFRENVNGLIEDIEAAEWESGLGDALFGGEGIGGLNYEMDNAVELREQLLGLQEDYNGLVMAGADAQTQWDEGVSPALDGLAEKYGLTREQVVGLADAIGLMPDKTETLINVATADSAAGVQELWAQIEMGKVEAQEPISIQVSDTDQAIENLEALGFEIGKVHDLGDGRGSIEVTAQTDQAITDIGAVVDAIAQIQSEKGITFSSNSRDEIDLIRQLGFEVQSTPNGDYRITSNTPQQIQQMLDLGLLVRDPMTGDVHVASNLPEVLADAERLSARNGNSTRETHTVDIYENHWTTHRNMGVQHTGGMAHGGRYLQGYAGGDRHGGYRLPLTGPGTNVTDGFTAYTAEGAPAARLDAGEWIINGDSSEKHNGLLHAINADDPAAILAQAVRALPGYAEGGRHSGGALAAKDVAVDPSIGGEVETILKADTTEAAQAVALVAQSVEVLAAEHTIPVGADTAGAVEGVASLAADLSTIPEPVLTVDAEDALTTAQDATEALNEVGVDLTPITLGVDTEGLTEGARQAGDTLRTLADTDTTPTAGLDTVPLETGASYATGELDTLGAQHPVPTADLDHTMLDGGVNASMDGLERVGASKATSVSDVDNTSALVNIQGVIDELNKMPVERVIKVVAHGSSGLADGGVVPGLATGGTIAGSNLPTTGPGTQQTDGFLGIDAGGMPLVRVDAGEYVTNRKSSAEYRTELDLINRGLFPKLDNLDQLMQGARRAPGLFQGGVVSPDQLLSFAGGNTVNGQTPPRSLEGAPYVWGGGLFSNWGDCSGAMSGLAALAVGMSAAGRKFATMNQRDWLLGNGFRSGLGPRETSFNLGWYNGGPAGGHTSGDIGGTNVEMGGGRGNGQIGGGAAPASSPSYTDHAHIALGELVAIDRFSPLPSVTATRMPAAQGGFSPTGGHGVSGGGHGVTLHDQGGWLSPGGFAFNGLSEPEPVLAPDHWRLVERLVGMFPQQAQLFIQAGESIDQAANELNRVAYALENPDSDDAAVIRALGGAAGGLLGMTGADGASSVVNGLVDAEKILMEQRAGQAERAEQVAEAEQQLADARAALAEINAAGTGMDVNDQRKLADAEQALAEARQGKDGKVDAERVADAEEKLRRTREDIASSAVEDEQRRQESVVKANDDIIKAEEALTSARRKQIESLDMSLHSLFPGIAAGLSGASGALAGFAGQLAGLGGIGVSAAGAVSGAAGQLAGLAAMAGPAGVSVGAVLAAAQALMTAMEMVAGIAGNIGDAVVGAFEGAASGADILIDAVDRLGSTMKKASSMVDDHIAAQSAEIQSRINVQEAIEALSAAERNQTYDRRANLREVQQAEFDLAVARQEASQVAGTSEVNLQQVRQQGIFSVMQTATTADAMAIQSASNVAMQEAQLAAARAGLAEADFINTRAVAQANTALERAQALAKFEMDRLTNASVALANAQALAAGEIAGATGLSRYVQGAQMVREAEAQNAAGIAQQIGSVLNPTRWFQGDLFGGANARSEAAAREAEGRAMMAAYAQEAQKDLQNLDAQAQAAATRAIDHLMGGRTAGQTFEQVLAGFTDVIGGNAGAASRAVSERQMRDTMAELSRIVAESQHRTDAAQLTQEREADRINREQSWMELDWKSADLAEALGSWEQRDYLADQTALMQDILAQHQQENAQLGQMNDKLTPKNMQVLMSVGGSGWGEVGPAAERSQGFGGLSADDLSLLNSTRMESGWMDEAVARALVPSPGEFEAAVDGTGWPYNLPETVVEGAASAASHSVQSTESSAVDKALAAILAHADQGKPTKPSGTTFTGPVTVQGRDSDRLIESLAKELTKA